MKSLCSGLLASAVAGAFVLQVSAAESADEKVVHSFCKRENCEGGASPVASLIDVNGVLYGTAYGGGKHAGGSVFSFDPNTRAFTVVYSFCSQRNCTDGGIPEASLINVKGALYGTAAFGGAHGGGVVFSLDPTTGVETVLHSFCDPQLQTTACKDGAAPSASLIDVDGTLYGTTRWGAGSGCGHSGYYGCGAVFSLDPATGAEKVVHAFCSLPNCADGATPWASLINVKGTLYGTTTAGGNYHGGTVFSIDLRSGKEQVVYSFCSQTNCADGDFPRANLTDVKGTLYGTTVDGGGTDCQNSSCGVLFSIDPGTGAETVLYKFSRAGGSAPLGGLINVNRVLYGTANEGGTHGYGYGTVFSFDPVDGTESVIYSFCSTTGCPDGQYPFAGLIKLRDKLYGTTANGGRGLNSGGVIFRVKIP